jgi:methyl coenzyme M reductase gamma subunit
MAGIMAVYSLSGILMIYRDTDFLKKEKIYEKVFEKNLTEKALGKEIKMKGFEVEKTENGVMFFKGGTYNSATGEAKYSKKELPFVLNKMTQLHKSQSKDTLSPLNAFFGFSLFFFVISSFWMFNTKSKAFKRGMIYAGIGFILALIMVFI